MAIEKLALIDEVTGGLYFAVNVNGQDYRISIGTVQDYILGNIPADDDVEEMITQYAAPSSSGFSVQVTNGSDNIHLILTPTAGFAAGTIVLPIASGAADKQEVLVNCTQQVTALTVDGNGAGAVTGEPTSLAADSFFRLKYDLPTSTWFRIG